MPVLAGAELLIGQVTLWLITLKQHDADLISLMAMLAAVLISLRIKAKVQDETTKA